jgi:hypothetical protein
MMSSAPSASWMTAVVTLSINRCPSVSTAMCRLRPLVFLPASYPPPGALGGLDRLAVQNAAGRTGFTALQLPIDHDRDVVDGNPTMAYQALQAEDKIGTMLPCNVIVQQREDGAVEVSAIDPAALMQAIDNPRLADVAGQVRDMLRQVVDELGERV